MALPIAHTLSKLFTKKVNEMSRFFHIRVPDVHAEISSKGGATVKVTNRDGDPLYVDVQVAYCSPMDGFCRKIGREVASATVSRVVPLGTLHRELRNIHDKTLSMCGVPKSERSQFVRDYSFVTKYFLPKE